MKALGAFITALSIPLMFLNLFGGIVAGIWLAILGQWGALGLGIVILFGSTNVLGFVIMPSLLLAAPASICAEKGKTLAMFFFAGLGSLYILAVLTAWCCGILFFFTRDATGSTLIPKLLWSYGLATGPWAYMASKDTQGSGSEGFASTLATFFAQLAYVTIVVLVFASTVTPVGAIKVFAGFMAVALIIQIALGILVQREQKAADRVEKDLLDVDQ